MHIKKILKQHRRDFTAIYLCEHCGYEHEARGYDDANFHQNVVPKMHCEVCNRTAGDDYRPLAPKHPEGAQI